MGIELTESEDNALRIEAARAGLSKRKFARKIVSEWLNTNHAKSLREIYNDILQGIVARTEEGSDERKEFLNALLAVSDGCGELVKLIIKMESAESGKDEELKAAISDRIKLNLKTLAEFCQACQITPFPDKPADVFAFELIDDYRPRPN